MVQNHLLRLASPKSWNLRRKTTKYIARPMPGAHPLNNCFTLSFMLTELLEHAKTAKEVQKILNEDQVLIDKVVRKDYKYSVGFMDIVEIPKLEEHYRVVYDLKGRFILLPIKKDEADSKLLKVVRKTVIKNGKMQVTLHDGRNILLDKFDGHVGDTILFDLKKKNISKVLPLEKGSLIYLSGGAHVGTIGTVGEVIKARDLQKPKVAVEVDGNRYITLAKYAFVVGKDKLEVSLEVKK